MRIVWVLTGVLAVAAAGMAQQQDAKAFLKRVVQKYRNAKSLELSAEFTIEMSAGANQSKQVIEGTLVMQRPNLVVAKAQSGGMSLGEVYCDGKHIYLYQPAMKQYMKQPAPPNFEKANALQLGVFGALLSALEQDVDKLEPSVKVEFRGTQTVAGKQTRVIEISESRGNRNSTARLFIGVQDLLVYRIEQTEVTRPQQQGTGGQGGPTTPMTRKITVNLRYASFNKPIPASRFRFTPPKDAKELKPPQPAAPATPAPSGQRR